jgi:hypothetical protein
MDRFIDDIEIKLLLLPFGQVNVFVTGLNIIPLPAI